VGSVILAMKPTD